MESYQKFLSYAFLWMTKYHRGFLVLGTSMPLIFSASLILILAFKTPLVKYMIGIKSMFNPDPPFITGARLTDCLLSGEFDLFFDTLFHYAPLILILSIHLTSLFSWHIRSSMLDALNQDYIRTARAKGCSEKLIIRDHAYRNSMLPTISVFAVSVPIMISSLALIEIIFIVIRVEVR